MDTIYSEKELKDFPLRGDDSPLKKLLDDAIFTPKVGTDRDPTDAEKKLKGLREGQSPARALGV